MMFDPKTVRQRKRKAGLRIYDNSGLRDNLNDEQAKPLLEWAVDHVEKGVDRTQYMEDEDAQSVIDEYVNTVSHVLRLVNGLRRIAARRSVSTKCCSETTIFSTKN